MRKYTLFIILLVSSVYAEPIKKMEVVNTCEPLERVCKAFGYQADENKIDGRGLYSGCVTLIVSGFPPGDIIVNNISPADIKACGNQIKTSPKKK